MMWRDMDRIVSKIAAGGLSAGVFLIWWPRHIDGEELEHFVLRGLLWTLAFELLMLAFGPLEQLAERRLRSRLGARRATVVERLATVPATARTGGAVALATFGLAVPLVLLVGAPGEAPKNAAAQPRVVKQVIVQRSVVERKVVVRPIVAAAETRRGLHSAAPARRAGGATTGRTQRAETKPAAAAEPTATATNGASPATRAPDASPPRTSAPVPAAPLPGPTSAGERTGPQAPQDAAVPKAPVS